MKTTKQILDDFINEGLIFEGVLPSVDPRQPQNTMVNPNSVQKSAPMAPPVVNPSTSGGMSSPSVPSVLDRPPAEEPSKPNPSQPGEAPKDGEVPPGEEAPEEKPEHVELGAASSGLALAEYHLRKLSELSGVEESELSPDKEKFSSALKVIQDTRKAIDECLNRRKEEPKQQTEDKTLVSAAIIGVGGEENLIDIVRSPDEDTALLLMTDAELEAIRKVRMGRITAPLFLKLKDGYHKVIEAKKKQSDIYKGMLKFDQDTVSEKEVEEKLKETI